MSKFFKPEVISLKNTTEITESMIQDLIANDPSIIGLGDNLILKDKERIQPKAGRLDILLQDSDGGRRYEVEIQLGKSDESHIIRTIEYWDLERKRYPNYDHYAVIIAENITSRFLNIISLFNGHIPLIAIQVTTVKVDGKYGLIFTKVLDEMQLGLVDEDEEINEPKTREYWVNKASEPTVRMAEEIEELVKEIDTNYSLKYNKYHINFSQNATGNNFAICKPRKDMMRLELRLPKSTETDRLIEKSGIENMGFTRRGRYVLRLEAGDIKKHKDILKELLTQAYQNT